MCFYEQFRYQCGDYKWGNCKQRCPKERRIGETCGMRLIMATGAINKPCALCEKIDIKLRRRAKELERITRWQREGSRFAASIEVAWDTIEKLDIELQELQSDLQRRRQTC